MPITELTTKETAARLGLSGARVIQLANQGKLKHQITPLGRLFDASDVERLRAERDGETAA